MDPTTASPAPVVEPLSPPAPVAAVAPQTALAMVKLTPDQTAKLDAQVDGFAKDLLGLPVHSDDFKNRVKAISAMGDQEIAHSASLANQLLDRPARAMNGGIFDSGFDVAKQLVSLRDTVERLDPVSHGDLVAARQVLR